LSQQQGVIIKCNFLIYKVFNHEAVKISIFDKANGQVLNTKNLLKVQGGNLLLGEKYAPLQ